MVRKRREKEAGLKKQLVNVLPKLQTKSTCRNAFHISMQVQEDPRVQAEVDLFHSNFVLDPMGYTEAKKFREIMKFPLDPAKAWISSQWLKERFGDKLERCTTITHRGVKSYRGFKMK